jgi:formate hydrogenlyase subunit 5
VSFHAVDTTDRVLPEVRARLREGARFAWLFGDRERERLILRYVLHGEGGLECFAAVAMPTMATITDDAPGARWHEREVCDRFGVRFDGLPEREPFTVPGDSASLRRHREPEVSAVLYGPVRSGIYESALWLVETAGEDFLHVEPSMFYKHRHLEERFTGADVDAAALIAEHVSGATAASHACAFASACENAFGIGISERAHVARTILLEFERIHQHLDVLAKLADDGSLSVGSAQMFAAKERVHRLLARATGSRFSRAVVCVGGTRFDVVGRLEAACESELDPLEREVDELLELYFNTPSLLDRLVGTGYASALLLRSLASVGPLARGSGISCDARLETAASADMIEASETAGDALARASVRRAEIRGSFHLIRRALSSRPEGDHRGNLSGPAGTGMSRIESPQGELLYYVRFDDGLARVAIRSASYQNWAPFAASLHNNIFTDFAFIEHSFGLLQAEVDR